MAETDQTPPPMRLQELIAARKDALRMTYDKMIDNAARAGHPIARSTLHFYALKQWKNIPSTDIILAIAAAICVEPDEVLSAMAASIGIRHSKVLQLDHGTRAVVAMLENKTPEQLRAVEDIVRSVTRVM